MLVVPSVRESNLQCLSRSKMDHERKAYDQTNSVRDRDLAQIDALERAAIHLPSLLAVVLWHPGMYEIHTHSKVEDNYNLND